MGIEVWWIEGMVGGLSVLLKPRSKAAHLEGESSGLKGWAESWDNTGNGDQIHAVLRSTAPHILQGVFSAYRRD